MADGEDGAGRRDWCRRTCRAATARVRIRPGSRPTPRTRSRRRRRTRRPGCPRRPLGSDLECAGLLLAVGRRRVGHGGLWLVRLAARQCDGDQGGSRSTPPPGDHDPPRSRRLIGPSISMLRPGGAPVQEAKFVVALSGGHSRRDAKPARTYPPRRSFERLASSVVNLRIGAPRPRGSRWWPSWAPGRIRSTSTTVRSIRYTTT
jgi:hypothetical protein